MGLRRVIRDTLATFVVSSIFFISLTYVYFHPDFDWVTLLVGVILPLVTGSLIFAAIKSRALLLAFLAYFWSLVDDKPVQFDSVLTWPEVTRFHPATPHIFMEVLLHALTLLFMVLAVWPTLGDKRTRLSDVFVIGTLTLAAFGLSYAQNIPLYAVQSFVSQDWFDLDIFEHIASFVCLWLAFRVCTKVRPVSDFPTSRGVETATR